LIVASYRVKHSADTTQWIANLGAAGANGRAENGGKIAARIIVVIDAGISGAIVSIIARYGSRCAHISNTSVR